MKHKILSLISIATCFLCSLFFTFPAHAACGCQITYADGSTQQVLGVETNLLGNADGCSCDDGSGSAITSILITIVNILEVSISALAVLGIIIAGVVYLTAGGDESKTRKAKQRIFQVVIGLVAFSLIWAFVNWLTPGGLFTDDSKKVTGITSLSSEEVAALVDSLTSNNSSTNNTNSNTNNNNNTTDNTTSSNFPNSSPSTTFTSSFVSGTYADYVLYTPSTAAGRKLPLIIFLHGDSGPGKGQNIVNIVGVINFTYWATTGLDGLNAYVMFPVTKSGNWNSSSTNARDEIWGAVQNLISAGKVDPYRVSIMGESSGSMGAQRFASDHPGQFSSIVLLSGYRINSFSPSGGPAMQFIYGANDSGPKSNASYFNGYSNVTVKEYSGECRHMVPNGGGKITTISCGHDSAVTEALLDDTNHDGKSDLLEWTLSQTSSSPAR